MKRAIVAVSVLFASCSNGRNDLMTKLLNEKKMINDSLPVLKSRSDSFINVIVDHKGDSAVCLKWAVLNSNKADSLNDRLPKILFSIDSLQKMQ